MRLPVKLNRSGWPALLGRLPVVREDPRAIVDPEGISREEFSKSLSVLKFGATFKTTKPGRQPGTNGLIKSLAAGGSAVVLDIGASDGSTSLDLIGELGPLFDAYFVTDLNVEARYGRDGSGTTYFRDLDDRCLLRASDRLLVYSDVSGAPWPLVWLSRTLLRGERRVREWHDVSLFQPDVVRIQASDPRISVRRYDMFTPWDGRTPTITKVANVLNRSYFSDREIAAVLELQVKKLAVGGHLVIVENRERERASAYRKTAAGMELTTTLGGGCEIAGLVPT